jgi:hypothetical protein
MHRHHHHHHDHGHDHHHDDHHHPHGREQPHEPHRLAGHNHAQSRNVAQWQTPHRPDSEPVVLTRETDLDKVESAFVESFFTATDQASFLRLACIPFEIAGADGVELKLLRVEIDALTDVGSLTPHLGGGTFRYDPLPANFVSQRRRLRFVYFDETDLRALSYAELRDAERIP